MIFFMLTVFLSFLKRERFPLFVQMRYNVPARKFLGVPDRSALQPFTVPEHLHRRSMSVFDRLRPFYDQQTMNDQGR
jgi:hypothetical protein